MISLPPILTLARSGATSRAWDAFAAAGLEGAEEVDVLTLKGRLLKDRARQAAGAERKGLFAQSGAAYAAAATLRPDSYPLINAAAMALFAGDGASAASIARDVLTLVDGDPAQGETPYWREATRAEAMLLLGRNADAQASLAAAVALAPQAWEDHAATLRQFAAILAQMGEGSGWLDAHRPPPSLHYRGVMGIDTDDAATAAAIGEAIARIAPGFAFGALAAGSDILVAEAILARGGELHVVLPADIEVFRESSVQPYGEPWVKRFDALIEQVHSLTICTDGGDTSAAAVLLADYQAMGMAAHRAALLETTATALRIEPDDRPLRNDPWAASARDMVRVTVPALPAPPETTLPDGALVFLLALASDAQLADPMGFATLAEAAAAIPAGPGTAALDCTISGNRDTVTALLRNAGSGSVVASSCAAMALMAEGRASRIEPLGEIEASGGPVGVYAVWLRDSG